MGYEKTKYIQLVNIMDYIERELDEFSKRAVANVKRHLLPSDVKDTNLKDVNQEINDFLNHLKTMIDKLISSDTCPKCFHKFKDDNTWCIDIVGMHDDHCENCSVKYFHHHAVDLT